MSRLYERVRRATTLALCLALVTAMVGLLAWALVVPPVPDSHVQPVALPVDAARTTYVCPSAPTNTVGAVAGGSTETSTTLTVLGDGTASVLADGDAARGAATPSAPLSDGTLTSAAADGLSVLLSPVTPAADTAAVGTVTSLSVSGDLRGLAAAPCRPGSALSWIVGGSTAVGSSSQLRLTNTGATTVTATVTLYGSTGVLPLSRGGQLAVPAGETASLLLESAGAQDGRIALSVEADGGALVASLATQSLDGETPAGVDLLSAGAGTGTDLLVPGVELAGEGMSVREDSPEEDDESGVADGGADGTDQASQADAAAQPTSEPAASPTDPADAAAGTGSPAAASGQDAPAGAGASVAGSVLRVVNPNATAATVSVSLVGADGEDALDGAQDVVVEPQTVQDISLSGLPAGSYAAHVTSDVPVAAAVRLARSGQAFLPGSSTLASDSAWVQAMSPAALSAAALALPGAGAQQGLSAAADASAPAALSAADASLSGRLVLTNAGEDPATVTIAAAGTDWSTSVTLEAATTRGIDMDELGVPDGARVLTVTAGDGSAVVGALVLTHEVTGGAADEAGDTGETSLASQRADGTLIAVLPLTSDVEVSAVRAVVVR